MPLTIKTTRLKYKDSNGDYVGVDAVAEQTTSEAVSDITSAKTTAITAIENKQSAAETAVQNKGTTTLASIPQDYTTLSGDVDALKEDLTYNGIDSRIVNDAYINTGSTKWASMSGYRVLLLQVEPGDKVYVYANSSQALYYTFLTSNTVAINSVAPYVSGTTAPIILNATDQIYLTAPSDAKYFYITLGTPSTDRTPSYLIINDNDALSNILSNINEVRENSKKYTDLYLYGARYSYTSDGYLKIIKMPIIEGHTYHIKNNGNPINIRYGDYDGTLYWLVPSSFTGETIVTAEHSGEYMRFTTNYGSVDLYIKDLSYDYGLKKNIIIDKNGNGDFTTLRAGIDYAIKTPHSKVFVREGTYNLLEEFATEISNSLTTPYGILLDNDVHVVFSSGAKVTALYGGSDAHVTEYFQPFYVSSNNVGGFTLENLVIDAKNTRYCVHDEYNGANVIINNNYINCQMRMDNTDNPPLNYYPQCIGGGTGQHTYVNIRGCYFYSKRAETQATPLVSYHNATANENALSYINIHDCYFDGPYGTYYFSYAGTAPDTNKSKTYLSGNSLGIVPIVRATRTQDTIVNVENIEWNNIIRSS